MGRAILGTVALIAERPFIGIENAHDRNLRSLLVSRYPYRVHYVLHDGEVWILHVRHTAREPLEPR